MESKLPHQSKTIIANVGVFVGMVVAFFGLDLTPETKDAIVYLVVGALPLANIVLRSVTKTPLRLK